MNSRTGFLFADPSFAEGVARLGDFSGTLNRYNTSSSPEKADRRAMRADIEAVRADGQAVTRRLRPGRAHKRHGR